MWKMHFTDYDNFFVTEKDNKFSFIKDISGKIIALKWNDDILKKVIE